MEQKPKSVMTLDEIKKLVERLKHYYVARADCREAAELIEAMYLAERANEFYVAIEDKINHEQ